MEAYNWTTQKENP